MAVYAFFPAAENLRRPDGIGFIIAEGADAAVARVIAQALVGGPSIEQFSTVVVGAGVDAVAVQGLPVGARNRSTWPKLTRGGDYLNGAS